MFYFSNQSYNPLFVYYFSLYKLHGMTGTIVEIILLIAACYLALGFLFAIAFIIKGVHAIDEGAHGSSIGFYIIIIPGVIVFWPVLLKKWIQIKGSRKAAEQAPKYSFAIKPLRKKHFQVWQILALLLPFIIIAAIVVRPEFPEDKLLQPSAAKPFPLVLKKIEKENYTVSLRANTDTSNFN